MSFAYLDWFRIVLFGLVGLIGVLVGLELPLLMRLLKENVEFKKLVSRVLSFDYLGALIASLLFPIVFVPKLGLVRTSLFFGLFNAGVALWGTSILRPLIKGRVSGLQVRAGMVIALLVVAFVQADRLTRWAEEALYEDAIIFAKSSSYQRVVITRSTTGFKLFLNGNLQFASEDEYRYHEGLVHPAMSVAGSPRRVLILGGGDGMAAREILRYPSVEHITLVDLDPTITNLGKTFPLFVQLNKGSLRDKRVHVINADALVWLAESHPKPYDVAIVDFPDPNSFSLGKLYTRRFYRMLRGALTPEAPIVVQSTSPLYARESFWCIVRTLEAAGLYVRPYRVNVPSFGVWGYALARGIPFDIPHRLPPGLRYLNVETLRGLFAFPADMTAVNVEINRLNDQRLVRYYETEWRRWERH